MKVKIRDIIFDSESDLITVCMSKEEAEKVYVYNDINGNIVKVFGNIEALDEDQIEKLLEI